MKNICIVITLLFVFSYVNAQKVQEIASKNIDEAIPMFGHISDFKNTDGVKLVGLGDVGELAKESKKLNTTFSAYMISKKNFRNIVIPTDDWLLRPLNTYLTTSAPADTTLLDSLIKDIFASNHSFRNREFRSLLSWLKTYNSGHRQDMVNIFGVAPGTTIPPSYFLAAYVYTIDKPYGQKLSEKWSNNATPDSIAYADIKIWVASLKNTKLSKPHQDLIIRCNEDLLHNKAVVKIVSVDQKFPPKTLNDRSRYIANQIIKKLGKKTIYLGSNTEVIKADLLSNFVLNDLPIYSTGKYLGEDLKDNYCVFVTDFADTARLPVVYISTKKIEEEVIASSKQTKALPKKNDYFDRKKDLVSLRGYQPILLSTFKEVVTKAIVKQGDYATDALFLFSQLSKTDLSY